MSSFSLMQISLFSRPSLTVPVLHFNILHGYFRNAICAAVKLLSSGVNWLISNSVSDGTDFRDV